MKPAYVDQALHLLNEPRTAPYVRTDVPLAGPYEGTDPTSPELGKRPPVRRGTSNGNVRGNAADRQKRREWLVLTYRADRDVFLFGLDLEIPVPVDPGTEGASMACRCYRCGCLLTVKTVTVDRIKPGCQGGTYARPNIRPACGPCNSETGGATRGRTRR